MMANSSNAESCNFLVEVMFFPHHNISLAFEIFLLLNQVSHHKLVLCLSDQQMLCSVRALYLKEKKKREKQIYALDVIAVFGLLTRRVHGDPFQCHMVEMKNNLISQSCLAAC